MASPFGVNGNAGIMDGIALKCDLHSILAYIPHEEPRQNVITESFRNEQMAVLFYTYICTVQKKQISISIE